MPLSLLKIFEIILVYKYYFLFPAVIIEGPIITVIAGFLSVQGLMNFYLAFLVIVAGDLAGDAAYYALGRWGRKNFIEKYGKFIGISPAKIAGLENNFKSSGGKIIIFGKLAHGIGTVFLVAAGASRMPFIKFMFYNLIATAPKSVILLLIGYFFGHAWSKIGDYFDYFALGALILAIGLLVLYYLTTRVIKKAEKNL